MDSMQKYFQFIAICITLVIVTITIVAVIVSTMVYLLATDLSLPMNMITKYWK